MLLLNSQSDSGNEKLKRVLQIQNGGGNPQPEHCLWPTSAKGDTHELLKIKKNEKNIVQRISWKYVQTITGNGGRKNVPSFAGNINIGPLSNSEKKQNNRQQNNRQQNNRQQNNRQQFSQNNNRQQQRFNQNNQQQFNQNRQQSNNQFNQNRQQNNNQFNRNRQQNNNRLNQNRQQQNSNRQQPRRNPLFAEQFPASNSGNRGAEQQGPANTQTRFEEQPRRPQPQVIRGQDRGGL